MTPYFIVLILVCLILLFVNNNKSRTNTIVFFLCTLILSIYAGIRNRFVGTDTNAYVWSFESERVKNLSILENTSSVEIGYLALEKFARILSDGYWVLLTLIALVVVGLTLKVINELSHIKLLSIFLFLSLGVYVFFFNGARQGIATAIYGIAVIHMIKGNLKKYLIWIGVAFLFHKTVLVVLPGYFLFRQKHSLKKTLLVLFLALVFITSWVSIVSLLPGFSDHYLAYDNRGAEGGVLLSIFFNIYALILIILRRWIPIPYRNEYDIYLNMVIFNALIYLVVLISGQDISFMRLAHYFMFGHILIWPIVFKRIKFFKHIFSRFVFISIHLVFYYIYLSKMSALIPYNLNSNIIF